jgi:acyl-CoA synthetase (AMP-forming)/AMP-acid ligase II
VIIDVNEAWVRAAARRAAGWLRATGVRAGDAVAVLAGNVPEFIAVRDAAAAIGARLVPLNPKLAPREMTYMLEAAWVRALIVCGGLEAPPAGLTTVARFEELAGDAPVDGPGIGGTILFTSGTTGRPKACLRTEAQETARVGEIIRTYSITRDDVHLIACPLAHSAPGIFLRAARATGARTVLLPRFDAAAARVAGATIAFVVPTQVARMTEDIPSLRALVVAGAPFPPAVRRRTLSLFGERLWEFYGSSETGTISVLPPAAQARALDEPGFVGWPPPGVEVRAAEDGELFVRSPTVMRDYISKDSAAWRDGFLSVGDLGRITPDGGVVLVDRKHDTVITGGVNVYPAEVERAIAEHPGVAGAVVTGVPHADWGEEVVAVVAGSVDEVALRAFLRERLAAYKIPKRMVFVTPEELPVGASGKPLRRAARALF